LFVPLERERERENGNQFIGLTDGQMTNKNIGRKVLF
jgi:hypothetical protein